MRKYECIIKKRKKSRRKKLGVTGRERTGYKAIKGRGIGGERNERKVNVQGKELNGELTAWIPSDGRDKKERVLKVTE